MTTRFTDEELEVLAKTFGPTKRKRKKMATGKKAFVYATTFCILLVIFSAVMVVMDKDTMTVSVFGGAGVACIPILYGIYDKYSNEISLKHMEMNYIPNYDEENGIK